MSGLTEQDIAGAVLRLPALPNIVLELIHALDDKDVDTHTLAQKISYDQTLTAKVLRLANSSFYGMQSKIGSIPHAITVLGFNSVRSLVLAAAVVDTFADHASGDLDHAHFWKHAIGTALCAKAIAAHRSANQDQSFIAGLLHNIGRLVLATCSPLRYRDVLQRCAQHDEDLLAAETHVFGIDHKAAGKAVLEYWKFPATIIGTLVSGQGASPAQGDAAAIAAVADAIAYALDLSGGQYDRVPSIPAADWDRLALNEAALQEIFTITETQFEEACAILGATGKA